MTEAPTAAQIAGMLSEPQKALLCEEKPQAVSTYRPMQKLLALGLLEEQRVRLFTKFVRTPAGEAVRAILVEQDRHD